MSSVWRLPASFTKKACREITIFERGAIGKEASYAAAGMLAPHAETDKIDDFFHFCNESNKLYPQFAEELFDETDVDIELDRERHALSRFYRKDVERNPPPFRVAKRRRLTSRASFGAGNAPSRTVCFARCFGKFVFSERLAGRKPQTVHALQKFAELNGIEIRENTEIKQSFNRKSVKNLTAARKPIREKFFAEKVILATGAWTSLIKAGEFSMPQVKPIRGQMISFSYCETFFSKVIYSPRGYLVPRFDGRVLAGATVEDAGFDKSVNDAGIDFCAKTLWKSRQVL